MSDISGCRVLVVEDEFLIAITLCDMLEDVSAIPVGPSFTVKQALQALRDHRVEAAILDVNLSGECSDPIAADLNQRGIPFVFTTGYQGNERSLRFGARIVPKPYDGPELFEALALAMREQTAQPADRGAQSG